MNKILIFMLLSFSSLVHAETKPSLNSMLSKQESITIEAPKYKGFVVGNNMYDMAVNPSEVTRGDALALCYSIGFSRLVSYEQQPTSARRTCYLVSSFDGAVTYEKSNDCDVILEKVTCAKIK